ncbi:MAG: hypothetical protein AAGC62_16565, partial [Pseudomonadota bacterium]
CSIQKTSGRRRFRVRNPESALLRVHLSRGSRRWALGAGRWEANQPNDIVDVCRILQIDYFVPEITRRIWLD